MYTYKPHNARLLPGRNTALKTGKVAVASLGKNDRGAVHDTVVVVAQDDTRRLTRHQSRETQFDAAERHIARPQEMIFRENEFLAHVDEGELFAVAEHCFYGDGRDRTYSRFGVGCVKVHVARCAYIFSTSPVFRSILIRSILSRLVPVTRTKRA